MFDLNGKTVVVTGGGRGIGAGITRMMAKAGATVVIAGRTEAKLADTAAAVNATGGHVIPITTDLTNRSDLDRLVQRTLDECGYIDTWVNNAGSANASDVGPLMNLTEESWDAVVDLNLKWTFFAAQAAARTMSRGGSIINISSRSGSQPNPMTGQYGASKAGVENLTATMAVEWGHLGIRVNAVAPGLVPTEESFAPGGTMSKPSRVRRQEETVPLRRLGTPDEVGALCVFLASDEAGWITGEVVQITGGSRIPVGYLSYMHRITEQLNQQ
ncbi:MAG: family oxidoreductase [Acidimicrobiia bacterium]|nr:family oxidoreductase [Acidimicrobiia bacterium]